MRLSDRAVRAWWQSTAALIAVLYIAGLTMNSMAIRGPESESWGSNTIAAGLAFVAVTLAFPLVGALILRSQPRNRIGWVLLLIGVAWGLDHVLTGLAALTWYRPGMRTVARYAVAIDQCTWIPAIGLTGTFLLLLFPDGKLLSRRWRPVAWVAGTAIVVGIVSMLFGPGKLEDTGFPVTENPLGIDALPFLGWTVWIAIAAMALSMIPSAASVVIRFRRSRGVERLQMKWLATAACVVVFGFGVALAQFLPFDTIRETTSLLSLGLIPGAVGVAVLKYRLYEIDVVINRSLVYGAMAAFITAVYVAIVVGVGAALGSGSEDPNLGLSIVATAVVALSFATVRERVQRVANRIVYGTRATPYEVLSGFSSRLGGSIEAEELLPLVARLVADATGAERSEVWLRLGGSLVREAAWPADEAPGRRETIAMPDPETLPELPGVDGAFPVSHQGELLGAFALRKARGEALTPADAKVAADLAGQAGLVLRSVRLVEDLKASRQRVVAAQDAERRRLERDIHDGAQQDLASLAAATNEALAALDGANPKASEMLRQAEAELEATLTELRELGRGIHPAVLTTEGLPAALASLAERSIVPVTVQADVPRRLDPTVEATAYYAVSEALQNVQKYAQATTASVTAEQRAGRLLIEVADDGVGGADPSKGSGLRGLLDRISAVNGELRVESPPGEGTRLLLDLPAR